MSRLAPLALALLAATALAALANYTLRGPSGTLIVTVERGAVVVNGSEAPIPVDLSAYEWRSCAYAVYGIYYSGASYCTYAPPQDCRFSVDCTAQSEFAVVVVKDPRARVVCKGRRGVVEPARRQGYVEVYNTSGISIECEASPALSLPVERAPLAALVGITVAATALFVATSALLLRRSAAAHAT
jgi:hypothetical protein